MTTSKKLALLACGILPSPLQEQFGDYHTIYSQWLDKTLPAGASFTLDPYNVYKHEYLPEDQIASYDGVIYTGSATSPNDNLDWINWLIQFTKRTAKHHPQVKLIGICFGHQIVGSAFGSECGRNVQWELGATPINLTTIGKALFNVDTLSIQQMHQDHVLAVPPDFHLLGSTPVSFNQGMVKFYPDAKPDGKNLAGVHIFTVQGHPEYSEPIITGLLEVRSRKLKTIPVAEAEAAEPRRFHPHDGLGVIAKTVWGVLGVSAQ